MNNLIFSIKDATLPKILDIISMAYYMPEDVIAILDLDDLSIINSMQTFPMAVRTNETGTEVDVCELDFVTLSYPHFKLPIEAHKLHEIRRSTVSQFGIGENKQHGRSIDYRSRYSIHSEVPVILIQEENAFIVYGNPQLGIPDIAIMIPLDINERIRWYQTVDMVISEHPRFAIEAMILGVPAYCKHISQTNKFKDLNKELISEVIRYTPGTRFAARSISYEIIHDTIGATAPIIAKDIVEKYFPIDCGSATIALNMYKRPGLVRSAVQYALEQTADNFILSMVNDGPEDATSESAENTAIGYENFRIHSLGENYGIPTSWNVAMSGKSQNTGVIFESEDTDWLTYTSSDNIQLPNQIWELIRAGEISGADIVVSPFITFGGVDGIIKIEDLSIEKCLTSFGLGPSFVIRRSILNETDLMQEDKQGIEDTLLTIDLLLCKPSVYFYKKSLYYYRSGDPTSLSFEIVKKEGGWQGRLQEAKGFLQQRTRDGINNLKRVIVDNTNNLPEHQLFSRDIEFISIQDFSCDICESPGKCQMYMQINPGGQVIIKKCPFAKFQRGKLGDFILFNTQPHICTERK